MVKLTINGTVRGILRNTCNGTVSIVRVTAKRTLRDMVRITDKDTVRGMVILTVRDTIRSTLRMVRNTFNGLVDAACSAVCSDASNVVVRHQAN